MTARGNMVERWVTARRLFALGALGLLLWQLGVGMRTPRYAEARWKAFFAGTGFAEPVPGAFRFYDMRDPGVPTPAFDGQIGNRDPRVRPYLQGTFIGGDTWTGAAHTDNFRVTRPWVFIPVAGSPAGPGINLTLCVLTGNPAQPTRRFTYAELNPLENLRLWMVDARTFQGAEAYLEMTDGRADQNGWLGVGRPLLGERSETAPDPSTDLAAPGTNYGAFGYATAVLAVLLFLPGVAAGAVWPRSSFAQRPAYLALPGLGLMVGHGLFLWLVLRDGHSPGAARGFLLVQLALALVTLFRGENGRAGTDAVLHQREFRWPMVFYVGVCAAALQFIVIPLPVAQEWFPQSYWASRMVASPPDNVNAYQAAVYLFHGKNGHQPDDGNYFHPGSSLTTRGPLVPLAINAAFNVFGHRPPDPPSYSQQAWPADPQDYFLARILGVLLNGLVVLGGIQLVAAFGARPGSPAWWFSLAWLALCPAVLVNTAFVWPKMLATCFVALAVAQAFTGGSAALTALFLAAGYYSHPVGGLYLPCLAIFWAAHRAGAGSSAGFRAAAFVRQGAVLAGWVTLFLSPWLLFKWWLAQPELFALYPFGDGNGTNRAVSVVSWLSCRWDSFFCTLVPFHIFFTGKLNAWFYGPLSDAMRWNGQYTKSLPGQLGFALCVLAYRSLFRPAPTVAAGPPGLGVFRNVVLIGGFFFSLLYWGFNSDGMGRQCLEPLTILLLAYAGAGLRGEHPGSRWRLWLLGVLTLEGLWVLLSGFVGYPAFRWERLRPTVVLQGCLVVLTLGGLLAVAWAQLRAAMAVARANRPPAKVGPGSARS